MKMLRINLLSLPIALISLYVDAQSTFNTSSKRGLIDISNTAAADTEFLLLNSDMTWYYNYGPTPTLATTNTNLTFVPMLFNTASTSPSFLSTITSMINKGTPVPFVMSFNEPDGTSSVGGSDISPTDAAATWKKELEPLRAMGVKLGAPAVTGAQSGFTWLSEFFKACDGGCTADFMTVHWYGDFEGLASNMGEKRGVYPNLPLWITEYALPNSNLSATQDFFNTSAEYFDRLDFVTHYSYFGSFRSSQSNVGPNVAMLDSDGRLTSIGSWYNGGKATNNTPTAGSGSSGSGSSGSSGGSGSPSSSDGSGDTSGAVNLGASSASALTLLICTSMFYVFV